ncbi:MAG: SMC-Scp complex subunit ScpB [Patescibacteria group bacterium]
MNLESKIEAILLFKNEPVSLATLSNLLGTPRKDLQLAIFNLQRQYENRGIVIVSDEENLCLGTNTELSKLIETIQKEELQRELGRAGLETLSIVLYKGPVSRREIDFIRGVNSGFILRNLLIRGLVERAESRVGERSFSYKPTLELLRHLGIQKREDLPEFGIALQKIESFIQNPLDDANE